MKTGIVLTAAVALSVLACDQDRPDPLPSEPPAAETYTSLRHDFSLTTVVESLEHPWGMAFLPNGDILVTERPGRLRMVRDGETLEPSEIAGVPDVSPGGQGGLLDVEIHPRFDMNSLVYLTYSKRGDRGRRATAVARGRLIEDRLEDVEEIFETDAWSREDVHYGSRLAFDADGLLYVSMGERGEMDEAQDLSNDKGAILRIHDDGSIPANNPFLDDEEHQPEIWAYGIRNAQGLAFHPTTGELWQSEHGPQGGDEINVIRRGANYGWPEITYGVDYDGSVISEETEREGMEQPVHYWEDESPAVSGLAIYRGEAFPSWQGDVFVAGLSGRHLVRLAFDGYELVEEEELLAQFDHRIRDVAEDAEGRLLILVDAPDGPMLRLDPVRD